MIYKIKDINRRMSEIIGDYISKGYIISPMTTEGSQSNEICRVDFYNDDSTIVRIEMTQYKENHIDTIKIVVESFECNAEKATVMTTLWNGRGETIHTESFYIISKGVYVTDYEEAVKVYKKQLARLKYDGNYKDLGIADFKDRLLKIVNSKTGYKGVRKSHITGFGVTIQSNGKKFYVIKVKGKNTIYIRLAD